MRRLPLYRDAGPAGDARPALLAVVALMLLLLPFLLLTTSPQKLTSLSLHLAADGGDALPTRTGAVEDVVVRLANGGAAEVVATVRRTDLGAAAGEVHARTVSVPPAAGGFDLEAIQEALVGFKALDPDHERARVRPADALTAQAVVEVVDAVRTHKGESLFPEVVLEGQP